MKKKQREQADTGGWLNTYADMVTLLLCFFAVMLSMSSTDEAKFNAFIESFSSLPQEQIDEILGNAEDPSDAEDATIGVDATLDTLYNELQSFIELENMSEDVEIQIEEGVIHVRFNNSILFYPDKYTLLPASEPILAGVGEMLVENQDAIRWVDILGFTATVGENASYWVLSAERAGVVAEYFATSAGFPADKILARGYANRYPIGDNSTEEGRAENRRVELIIVGMEVDEDKNWNDILESFYSDDADVDTGDAGTVEVTTPGQSTEEESPAAENETTTAGETVDTQPTTDNTQDSE